MQRSEAAGCGEQVKNEHGAENSRDYADDVDGCVRRAKLVLTDALIEATAAKPLAN